MNSFTISEANGLFQQLIAQRNPAVLLFLRVAFACRPVTFLDSKLLKNFKTTQVKLLHSLRLIDASADQAINQQRFVSGAHDHLEP